MLLCRFYQFTFNSFTQTIFNYKLILFFRPLKDDEFLPVPSHRATSTTKKELSSKKPESSKKEEKQSSKSTTSKKDKEKSKVESKASKKEKKKDSTKEKKSSKKSKDINNTVDLLISTDLNINRNETEYNELISPDQESNITLNGISASNHQDKDVLSNTNEKMVY